MSWDYRSVTGEESSDGSMVERTQREGERRGVNEERGERKD